MIQSYVLSPFKPLDDSQLLNQIPHQVSFLNYILALVLLFKVSFTINIFKRRRRNNVSNKKVWHSALTFPLIDILL